MADGARRPGEYAQLNKRSGLAGQGADECEHTGRGWGEGGDHRK